jgi:tetratricopeptide (TPR) repeat protein
MDNFQTWQRDRLMIRAHNHLGYLYWLRGRYNLAVEQYNFALEHDAHSDLKEERANVLNNMAYIEALLGKRQEAFDHINRAVSMRQVLGKRSRLAYSYNTRGLINAYNDDPMWGSKDSQRALELFREVRDKRGEGLAYLALGFAKRLQGNQWKLNKYYEVNVAVDFFREAQGYLDEAVKIFDNGGGGERMRLWEAYNELGSLFCDWAWLTRKRNDDERPQNYLDEACAQYEKSIQYQLQALKIAEEYGETFQMADSYDDLAQVYGDQSFLYIEMKRSDQARKSRLDAESYLDKAVEQVPAHYQIETRTGFEKLDKLDKSGGSGDTFLQILGKAHFWRSLFLFRDLGEKLVSKQEQEQTLNLATEQICLATAYFFRFSPTTFLLSRTQIHFTQELTKWSPGAAWVRSKIDEIEKKYNLSLDVLRFLSGDIIPFRMRHDG